MTPTGLFHLFIDITVRILGVLVIVPPILMRAHSLTQRAAAGPRRSCRADAARDYVAAVMVTWALASVGCFNWGGSVLFHHVPITRSCP